MYSLGPPRKEHFGDIRRPIVEYRGYPVCSLYLQLCSVSGSSDAAFCCQRLTLIVAIWNR